MNNNDAQSPSDGFIEGGKRYRMTDPLTAPRADTFLWNERMLLHINAHGFTQSQFMQPEPSFYSHAPQKAAAAAMAPEPQYYDHHPGRFFYIKDEGTGNTHSVPYRPMCKPLDCFSFEPGISDVRWIGEKNGIESQIEVVLPLGKDVVELWKTTLTNRSRMDKSISFYAYFPVGFPSWMNTEAGWDSEIHGMLAYTLTPYRQLEDYYRNQDLKDYTFLISSEKPDSWESRMEAFEGEGGLRAPEAIKKNTLDGGRAEYESAACILQFRRTLKPGESWSTRFLFGPAKDRKEISTLSSCYKSSLDYIGEKEKWAKFYKTNRGCLQLNSSDSTVNHLVNHWIPRQILYHAYTYRMVTDPQTRNYIQDSMGMNFIDPTRAKDLYSIAWAQQRSSGEMPDGLIVYKGASLKYINQVPHRDHCVWGTFALASYIEESGDGAILDELFPFADSPEKATVYEHIARGIEWLLKDRSERGFSFIGQGDWCDPMNMAGHKGKGESIWLTQATLYAVRIWLPFAEKRGDHSRISKWKRIIKEGNERLNSDAWIEDRYARGFTDDGLPFGIDSDEEGKIFLNTQSWGILCGAALNERIDTIIETVNCKLKTPYGLEVLAPSYSHIREDIGRLTQKHPSTAENGSVYCHANAFYLYALYKTNHGELAWPILRSLIPGPDKQDISQREHLPLYIPNYYRGNYHPEKAGKASHLMNTGSLVWIYRCIVEEMLGLRGEGNNLIVSPQLPKNWEDFDAERTFRGKIINISYRRDKKNQSLQLILNEKKIKGNSISNNQLKKMNSLTILFP